MFKKDIYKDISQITVMQAKDSTMKREESCKMKSSNGKIWKACINSAPTYKDYHLKECIKEYIKK